MLKRKNDFLHIRKYLQSCLEKQVKNIITLCISNADFQLKNHRSTIVQPLFNVRK